MSGTPISGLPEGTNPAGVELVPIVQDGATVRVPTSSFDINPEDVRTITGNASATVADQVIVFTGSSDATLTLYSTGAVGARALHVKNDSSYALTIAVQAGETGGTSLVPGEDAFLVPHGTEWERMDAPVAGVLTAQDIIAKGPVVDVRAFMDGLSGRPTLAAWLADMAATDVTGSIQAAINSLSAGTVFFPEGAYKVTAAITGKDSVNLVGVGYGSQITRAFTGNGQQIISLDGIDNATVSGLRITGDVASPDTNNSRIGISVTQSGSPGARSKGVIVERCWIDGVDIGVQAGGATERTEVRKNIIGPTVDTGVMAGAGGALPGGFAPKGHIITQNTIGVSNTSLSSGVYITGSGENFTVSENYFYQGTYGVQLYITDTTAQNSFGHRIVNNTILSSGKDGVLASVGHATNTIRDVLISGNYLSGQGESGVLLRGATKCKVLNNTLVNQTNHGVGVIYYTAASTTSADCDIAGNTITGGGAGGHGIILEGNRLRAINNTISGRTNDGARLQATTASDGCEFIGNSITGNGGRGLYIAGTATNYRVVGNTYSGNTGVNIRDDSASGSYLQAGRSIISTIATGATVQEMGSVGRTVYKATFPTASFTAAALTQDIIIAKAPAKVRITSVFAEVTQGFAGTGWLTASLRVGKSAGGQEYLVDFSATSPVNKGLADADLGTSLNRANAVQGGDLPSWTATTNLYMRLTTTGGNISAITAGSVTVYIVTEGLP